eukprot:scaffold281481_cov32-Tisochrysis_lutea.AAC.4
MRDSHISVDAWLARLGGGLGDAWGQGWWQREAANAARHVVLKWRDAAQWRNAGNKVAVLFAS